MDATYQLQEMASPCNPQHRTILFSLHHLLTEEFNLTLKFKYNLPFYYNKSWVCYANPTSESIELSFIRGNELADPDNLLQAKNRKMVRSLPLTQITRVNDPQSLQLIHEAILLDEQVTFNKKMFRS